MKKSQEWIARLGEDETGLLIPARLDAMEQRSASLQDQINRVGGELTVAVNDLTNFRQMVEAEKLKFADLVSRKVVELENTGLRHHDTMTPWPRCTNRARTSSTRSMPREQ